MRHKRVGIFLTVALFFLTACSVGEIKKSDPLPKDLSNYKVTQMKLPVSMQWPEGIAVLGDQLVVADQKADMLYFFSKKGELLKKIGGTGAENGKFNRPDGVAIGPDETIYVVDTENYRIQIFDKNGNYFDEIELASSKNCRDTQEDFYATDISVLQNGLVAVTTDGMDEKTAKIFLYDQKKETAVGENFNGFLGTNIEESFFLFAPAFYPDKQGWTTTAGERSLYSVKREGKTKLFNLRQEEGYWDIFTYNHTYYLLDSSGFILLYDVNGTCLGKIPLTTPSINISKDPGTSCERMAIDSDGVIYLTNTKTKNIWKVEKVNE